MKIKASYAAALLCPLALFLSCYSDSAEKNEPGAAVRRFAAVQSRTSGAAQSQRYEIRYRGNIGIRSFRDGTIIAANMFMPVPKTNGELFPVIIFINSWGFEEHEYLLQSRQFAQKGYLALSYSCRGWGLSGGKISMGGPEDWDDFSSVIDWLEQNAPIARESIGVCGMSLGGGGALLAVSHDPRVKTAAAMSSFTCPYESMFSDDTPRLFWGGLLVTVGTVMGHMKKKIYEVFLNTMINRDIDELKEWCDERSPQAFADELNRLNKPVFLAHNIGDYLFRADVVIDYFNMLRVDHKRLELSIGSHMTTEGISIFGFPTPVYDDMHKWFDYWLKGMDTGIIPDPEKSAVITMQVKGETGRETYTTADLEKQTAEGTEYTWPARSIREMNYYLGPRGADKAGTLQVDPNDDIEPDHIHSALISGATAGIPLLSQILESLHILVKTKTAWLRRDKAILYQTPALEESLLIRGNPAMRLRVSLSERRGQIFLYLYDIDARGRATFITHGFKTFWNATPREPMTVPISFVTASYTIRAGHRLGVVMDTNDPDYGKPTLHPFTVRMQYGESEEEQSVLRVPVDTEE